MEFHWLKGNEGEHRWDEALNRFPDAPFSLLYGWRKVYEKALGLKTYYLLVEEQGQVTGLCPLVYMKSPFLGPGSYLISLPFMTRAGIWVQDSRTREVITDRIIKKAGEIQAGLVELRELKTDHLQGSVLSNNEHVQMVLDLPEDWTRFEKEIAPRLRQVKKARKAGLEIRQGNGEELLADFYRVFSQRMRELVFPVYPKAYFRTILEYFEKQTRLVLVYDQGRPLGGMLLFTFKDICSAPYVATLIEQHSAHPNQLLYYSAIRQAWEQGCRTFDFCRSQIGSGTFTFKSQWKAQPRSLAYLYPACKDQSLLPTIGQARGSWVFQLAEKVWPHLPLPVTQWLGGRLIRHLVLA